MTAVSESILVIRGRFLNLVGFRSFKVLLDGNQSVSGAGTTGISRYRRTSVVAVNETVNGTVQYRFLLPER